MKSYNLTATHKYFRSAMTYYSVPALKIPEILALFASSGMFTNVFIYRRLKGLKITDCPYVCSYSTKYKNYSFPGGIRELTPSFL